jgi:hypothetical protein
LDEESGHIQQEKPEHFLAVDSQKTEPRVLREKMQPVSHLAMIFTNPGCKSNNDSDTILLWASRFIQPVMRVLTASDCSLKSNGMCFHDTSLLVFQ